MRDVHVHFLHGNVGGYTQDFYEGFITAAERAGLTKFICSNILINLQNLKACTLGSRRITIISVTG